MNVKAVILAGGKGKRMKSDLPKVLSTICGDTLIRHVEANIREANIGDIAAVTGYKSELVRENAGEGLTYFLQEEQLGTAHALNCARSFFENEDCSVIVLCGDAPLVSGETISDLVSFFDKNDADICVLSAKLPDPAGYGRIVRGGDGTFERIVEKRDATPEQILINEVNSGTIIFRSGALTAALDEIMSKEPQNAQGEYYLTDTIEITASRGGRVFAFSAADPNVVMGANDRYELSLCEKAMRESINRRLMLEGVRMIDPACTYIDRHVKVAEGCVIYPNTVITGSTQIGRNNTIYSSRIDASTIGDNNLIDSSVLESCLIGDENTVGPFAHLRKDTVLSCRTKVGSFSETKASSIGEGTKIPHLSYVGDAQVGKRVNFGCGCVTANYDGNQKHPTVIKDDAFIGCNVNLIAPVTVGSASYIAAGSSVSRDVPDGTLVIERSKRREHKAKLIKKQG